MTGRRYKRWPRYLRWASLVMAVALIVVGLVSVLYGAVHHDWEIALLGAVCAVAWALSLGDML